jgi:hypothetical protein
MVRRVPIKSSMSLKVADVVGTVVRTAIVVLINFSQYGACPQCGQASFLYGELFLHAGGTDLAHLPLALQVVLSLERVEFRQK